MTLKEQVLLVDSLLSTILYPYREKGETKIFPEQRELLKQLYGTIFGTFNIDVHCNTCVIHYLCMFEAWLTTVNLPQEPTEPVQPMSEQIADHSAKKKKGGCSSCKNKK